LKLKIFFLIFR